MKKIFVILFGILFVGVGIFAMFQGNDLAKRCTTPVTARVINLDREESVDSDGYTSYAYYPIFEYQVGEKTLSEKGRTGSSNPKYSVGDKVEILYDANKPTDFIVKGDTSSNILGIVFIVAGLVVAVIGVVKNDF